MKAQAPLKYVFEVEIPPFGRALRRLRKERGVPQWFLAERAGLSQGQVSYLELGKYAATLETLCRIAAVFDMSLSEFIAEAEREET